MPLDSYTLESRGILFLSVKQSLTTWVDYDMPTDK